MPGYEIIGEEEKEEILDVLSRKMLFRYEFDNEREGIYKVEEFEREFAMYCGVNHAHAVSSGTAALRVALSALGIGPGDEVITQGFTFVATWETIFDTGALPVFAEIDDTLCLDPYQPVSVHWLCLRSRRQKGSRAADETAIHNSDFHKPCLLPLC